MKKFVNCLCLFSLGLGLFIIAPSSEVQAQERRVAAANRRATKRAVTHRVARRTTRRAVTRHYYGRPRLGLVVRAVPTAARVVRFGTRTYYLDQGVYYIARGSGFAVVRPAVGLRIRTLPRGFVRTVVRGRPYYYYYGTFYASIEEGSDEYEVVAPPAGAVVDALPEGYEAVEVDGQPYLALDGTYYETVETDLFDNGYGYRVVNAQEGK